MFKSSSECMAKFSLFSLGTAAKINTMFRKKYNAILAD